MPYPPRSTCTLRCPCVPTASNLPLADTLDLVNGRQWRAGGSQSLHHRPLHPNVWPGLGTVCQFRVVTRQSARLVSGIMTSGSGGLGSASRIMYIALRRPAMWDLKVNVAPVTEFPPGNWLMEGPLGGGSWGGEVVKCDISPLKCHTFGLAMLQVVADRVLEETRPCMFEAIIKSLSWLHPTFKHLHHGVT